MKRKLTTLMAVTMSLTLVLTACGGKNNNAANNSNTKKEDSNLTAVGTLPIVKKKVTLKAVSGKAPMAPNFDEMAIQKTVESMTNVDIEWNNIPQADFIEKRNLLLASGNLPDIFYGSGFTDPEIVKYGKDGTIIPLNDVIEKYMPNVKKILDSKPLLKAFMTAPDGNIYTLPGGEEMGFGREGIGANPNFLFINKAWLDKLKLAMPTTLDEYYNVLKAFKTQDPNGNGKPDEIPLTFINGFWTGDIGYLFGAFGTPDKTYQPGDNTYIEHLNVKDGKVNFAAQEPGYKEAVSTFGKWVKEGLIDKEAFIYDVPKYFAVGKTKDERVGSFIWWEETEIVGPDRAKDYVLLPPFKDMVVEWNNGSAWGRGGHAITKACKNVEVAARYLDSLFDQKISAQLAWGPIGDVFEEKDGKLAFKPLPDGVAMGEYRQKVAPGGGLVTSESFGSYVPMEDRAVERINRIKQYFTPQMEKENYPNIFFTEEELNQISKIKPDLAKYVNQKRAQWLMNGGVEKEWDDYNAKLKQMGIEDLMKIYQDGLDRYNAAMK